MNKIQNEYLYKVYDLDLQINSKKMESRDFLCQTNLKRHLLYTCGHIVGILI